MANDDRVRAALNAFRITSAEPPGYSRIAMENIAMSAALDAADAVALTPAQREAEGMLEVLRNMSKTLDLAECDSDVVIHAMNADANICEILARIDGGK
jgi:hypothetical protein